MFIDDNGQARDAGTSILAHYGYTVRAYDSADDALLVFEGEPDSFDVILTDQTMPGLTGTELATRIKQIRRDIPIIIMSGYNEKVSANNCREFGADSYVTKPFTPNELALAVEKAIRKSGGTM